ncbi:MAG TPA: transposase [Vicinamibacteria bacterium]|nr:transposase [Vicinamibacteria bacterium]
MAESEGEAYGGKVSSAEGSSTSKDASGFVPAVPHPEKTTESDLDRTGERVLARFGLLSEAEVRYVSGEKLQFAGSLLILPALVGTGFFASVEKVYGNLKNGFYGLRHTVMTAALMVTLRIPRAEHLSGVSPTALGRLLGLDRAPEVKTLRRRLREIADLGKADEFMRWFAEYLAGEDREALGFLYVDGHTRIYYGQRQVSKAYSTRKRLAVPAVTDFWVNDRDGQPIFVVTGEVNQSLTKQLPPLVEELKKLLRPGERLTILFDRGAWSPKLFKELVEADCDFVTYRKGKIERYPVKDFTEQAFDSGEQKVSYMLRDGVVRFGVGMQFRQIVRREANGDQIAIVTSRNELAAAELVFRLGTRWRQENYFKYARDEFALDALDSYRFEAEDPDRTVPNPKRKPLEKKMRALRKRIGELEAKLGHAADTNEESRRPTVRGLKIAHGPLRQELAQVREELARLVERRGKLPARVTIAEATDEQAAMLEVEHKHFMNAVKMAVYRAESSLFQLMAPHYARGEDEGRAVIREALRSSGAIEVEGDELRVTLYPMSAPRHTRAIAALCQQLNDARVRIPGTTLRLRFAVSRETGVSELAMAPCQEV